MRLCPPIRHWADRRFRAGVAIVSLLGYLAAVVGHPMPTARPQGFGPAVPLPTSRLRLCRRRALLAVVLLLHAPRKTGLGRAHHVMPPSYAEQLDGESLLAHHDHGHDADAGHDGHDHCAQGAARRPMPACAGHACHAHTCEPADQPEKTVCQRPGRRRRRAESALPICRRRCLARLPRPAHALDHSGAMSAPPPAARVAILLGRRRVADDADD